MNVFLTPPSVSQVPKTLDQVPTGEVWLDTLGYAVWHDGDKVMSAGENDGTIFVALETPESVKIVRKLSDPIVLAW